MGWRKGALGVVLAPLLLLSAGQSGITCQKTGDTSLQILEVEFLGVNQITFDTALRAYSVWPPPAATTFRLRALSTDPEAVVTYNLLGAGAQIGTGGGVVVLNTPPQWTPIFVWVKAPGGKSGAHKVTFNPLCPQDDICDFGGSSGVCFGGMCETDPPTGGTLLVNGDFNLCAELTLPSISATSAERGAAIDVSAQVTDPESDPIDYMWTATGGSFDDPSAQSATYICDDPGPQVIALGISDDGFDQCIEEWSTIVVCGDTYLCAGVDCDDGDICTDDSCDPATGLCDQVPTSNTSDEVCDGIDNDCNGEVDDGFNLGNPCTVGVGECQAGGTLVCAGDGQSSECSAVAGAPPEPVEVTCADGLDNDCDGNVDSNDLDCPQTQCPCFTAEELALNRPYDNCFDWDVTSQYGPGLYVNRDTVLIGGKSAAMKAFTNKPPHASGMGCNFQGCAYPDVNTGDSLPYHCNYTRAFYESNGVLTLDEWNACYAMVQAEIVNAGITCQLCTSYGCN